MHCSSPKMVCETKIVADEHESIPGPEREPLAVSAARMWPPSPGKGARRDQVFIRDFQREDYAEVRRIFNEGIMERIPNSAFRGLKQQSHTQFLYAVLTVMCFVMTKSVTLTCCTPFILMGARYYYSRKVIFNYLDCALHTDMADIEAYYMKPTGSRFWVAVLEGQVVGIVAAQGREEDNTVELRRMSVDSRFRGKGIAKALGRRVLEFAMLNNYSAVVLGTTAVKMAAHKLYESLGFQKVDESEDYTLPGMSRSFFERLFFQIRYSRYRLQLHEE
ncbi:N-acetylaspartate synthetase [Astyanax mexicanus]|uniref:N-acetylaspartate synthetase n=2 Tax=Astyanax mexicanus TaxID=7994 RepID=A0A8B9HRN4_ASTMX|nr:N-acetylaspartate synthetase [Astyanax mexicanus]KAG9274444.1 N-acetylaspartate synthetase [Astyanax mexicanus]